MAGFQTHQLVGQRGRQNTLVKQNACYYMLLWHMIVDTTRKIKIHTI